MDGIVELASLFKERDNQTFMGIQLAKVIKPLPDIQLQIGKDILLEKDDLYISQHLLEGYKRNVKIVGNIDIGNVQTTSVNDGGENASSHSHEVSIKAKSTTITGEQTNEAYLKAGDYVIIIPTQDEQTYFVIDKGVRL